MTVHQNVAQASGSPESGIPFHELFDMGKRLLACGQGLTLRELAFVLNVGCEEAEFIMQDIDEEHVIWQSLRGGEIVYRLVGFGRLIPVDVDA